MLCNVNQGAKIKFPKIKDLPKEMIDIFHKIDKKFSKFVPRLYTMDFIVSLTGKVYLIEINLSPGFFFYQTNSKVREVFFRELIKTLKS